MFARVRLEYVATKDVALKPKHKGNLIRSAIGAGLKRLKDHNISFDWVFRGNVVKELGRILTDTPNNPIPLFAPECLDERQEFKEGDKFSFSLVLLLPQICWEFFYATFRQMFAGYGFQFQGAYVGEDMVADRARVVQSLPEWSMQGVIDYYGTDDPVTELEIQLKSPFRTFRSDELVREPGFADIVYACVRRVQQLAPIEQIAAMSSQEQAGTLDLSALDELASFLETVESVSESQWVNWRRIRSEDKKGMMMGGAVGSIKVKSPFLNPFLSLLGVGELLHIGKGTTMGNGIISFE